MAFTDIQDSANWRSTYLQSFPWTTTPAYASLEGFSLKMLFPDMLHVWNLGVARDLIGTAMKTILQDRIIFDGPNIDARLKQATESLRAYARANKYGLKMKRFTKKKLTWQAKKFPEFRGSGSDAHVVGVWLGDLLAPYSDHYRDICSLFWCSNRLVRLLYSGDRFFGGKRTKYSESSWAHVCTTLLEPGRRSGPKPHVCLQSTPKAPLVSSPLWKYSWVSQSSILCNLVRRGLVKENQSDHEAYLHKDVTIPNNGTVAYEYSIQLETGARGKKSQASNCWHALPCTAGIGVVTPQLDLHEPLFMFGLGMFHLPSWTVFVFFGRGESFWPKNHFWNQAAKRRPLKVKSEMPCVSHHEWLNIL